MAFLLIILALVLVNAFFSAAEIALVSVKKYQLQQEADKGNKKALQVLDVIREPDEYLSSIQVGITLVGMIEGLYGGEFLASLLEPKFIHWGMPVGTGHFLALVISIGLITYVTIVIGELLPKSLALQFPQKVALQIASSFRIFTWLAYPFVKVLTASTHLLIRILNIRTPEKQAISESDLRSLLSLAYRQGTLEKEEWVLHENIFNFYEIVVGKIMTPAEKVTIIDEASPRSDIESVLRQSRHGYFPVVHQEEGIRGLLSARDFFMYPEKTVRDITKSSCMIKGTQTASDLLNKFKEKNQNFAIVVHDTGALAGIVTMHDVGEVLIGKIP